MDFINQMEPWFDNQEQEALNNYMGDGGWVTEFKKTFEFQDLIKQFTGAKHCFIVNNGTISLTIMAMAAGIKAGDEVLVPNYTMVATPNSLKMFGAEPKFIDVDPKTLCISLDEIKKNATSKTKAVFLMNANGRYPSDINEIVSYCKDNNLILLEDSAQALGSFYPDGVHQGRKGIAGSFSFSAPKIISTGQGGAIITDDDELAYYVSRLKDFGRSGGGNDVHDMIGFNFKFTDIQAVLGIVQMSKLDWRVNRMREIYTRYKENLIKIKEVQFFDQDLKNTTPWFIDVMVDNREELMTSLKQSKIGSRIMYPPINKQQAYNLKGNHIVSNLIGEKGLWLPSSSKLTNDQIDYVCAVIKEFYSK
ncbi:DegT/DnrJ/EryC1/StrS aminotransferase family protein [Nonlabens sp.]|uniref:DegT/DnrJ/EryC1/StrS family aminotransferase n=1 Tax=Nonlabens sp. TaxID=1888209 RepID=UPI001BCC15CA|nr:DegT/DnrJ/EryC1/StrS family aminotransferase [Nonlabens sp.]